MNIAHLLPPGYAISRDQANDGTGMQWHTTLFYIPQPRVLLAINEDGKSMRLGAPTADDIEVIGQILKAFISYEKKVTCYDRIPEVMDILKSITKVSLRLTTRVNSGRMMGASMGIDGLDSILQYVNHSVLAAESYLTIS